MNILATATVIRGKGACETFVNDIRDTEMSRINELHNDEMKVIMNELKKTKDSMRMMPAKMYDKQRIARKIVKLKYGDFDSPDILYKIRHGIELIWVYIWVYGVKWGLFGYWDEEEDERIRQNLRG